MKDNYFVDKNPDIKDFSHGNSYKAWWQCEKGHEWQATINSRTFSRAGCPYCSGNKIMSENSILYTYPKIALEWDYVKNKDIDILTISSGSSRKVWWKCNKNHEWKSTIYNRTMGKNCPYCSGKKVAIEKSIFYMFPNMAAEWDYDKNSDIDIMSVGCGSRKNVWWKTKDGKSLQQIVSNRVRKYRKISPKSDNFLCINVDTPQIISDFIRGEI